MQCLVDQVLPSEEGLVIDSGAVVGNELRFLACLLLYGILYFPHEDAARVEAEVWSDDLWTTNEED